MYSIPKPRHNKICLLKFWNFPSQMSEFFLSDVYRLELGNTIKSDITDMDIVTFGYKGHFLVPIVKINADFLWL